MHQNESLLNRDQEKGCCFTQPRKNFNKGMLQTFHEDPQELYQLVENGHPKSPLRNLYIKQESARSSAEIQVPVNDTRI